MCCDGFNHLSLVLVVMAAAQKSIFYCLQNHSLQIPLWGGSHCVAYICSKLLDSCDPSASAFHVADTAGMHH